MKHPWHLSVGDMSTPACDSIVTKCAMTSYQKKLFMQDNIWVWDNLEPTTLRVFRMSSDASQNMFLQNFHCYKNSIASSVEYNEVAYTLK